MISQKQKIINTLQLLQLENVTIEEIMNLLNQLLDRYSLTTIFTSDIVLYRAIKYSSKPTSYEALIYPPIEKAKLNRASDKGEQLFYATTKKKAAFYELDAKPGDNFILSTWVCSLPLLLSNIGYTSENLIALGAEDNTPLFDINDKRNKVKIEDHGEHEIISNYLSKAFSQQINNENTYKLTIAIAKKFMGEIGLPSGSDFLGSFDGLLYPTIKYSANADNVALKKHVIDSNKLSIDRIEYIRIINQIENKYEYKILDIADSITNNFINWKRLLSTWTVNDESDDIYFADKKAYNEFGDEIAPDK